MAAEVPGDFAGRDGDAGRDGAVRLPPRRLSFVGRTADLAEVAARLGRYPVVTLTGVGGSGRPRWRLKRRGPRCRPSGRSGRVTSIWHRAAPRRRWLPP